MLWLVFLKTKGLASADKIFAKLTETCFMSRFNQLLVIACLGGQFGINCPSAILKILKLPE